MIHLNNIIGKVLSSAPNLISIMVDKLSILEDNKEHLQIGKYLKISEGNNNHIISIIQNLKAINYDVSDGLRFIIDSQPIGCITEDGLFHRGSLTLPVPTEPVYIVDTGTLDRIFRSDDEFDFPLGVLSQNKHIELNINGNKFFSKHIAVVGSTGAGKSCAVSKILQNAVGINNDQNQNSTLLKNSHIVIFDIHSEYAAAFTLEEDQNFTLNDLTVDKIKLPYWLMNSEELEAIFIESNESNSHNQVSQFKNAVILNKQKYNSHLSDITYDTPVFFAIKEVFNYIENMNREVIGKLDGENCPKLSNGTLITNRKDYYFSQVLDFVQSSTSKDNKASNGPFYGEFNRFVSRLETKLSDKRLSFLLNPQKEDGSVYKTNDFEEILKQFLGYINKSNVTIVDLSGVPFEVLSITVSLISRLIFDFCFHYSKLKHKNKELNDIPVLVVCEEAHNYIPRSGGAEYNSSKKSIERIAKEGRKYGLSLMVVSQRPSEVSETIFAQCNNYVALRLTNHNDQAYVRNLMPESSNAIAEILPNLSPGECLVVGDAVLMPTLVQLEIPKPEPKSQSIKFHSEWNLPWKDVEFSEVVKRWRKE
ncbi:ATP-binding protein [Paenibacillus sp. FSL R7-0204]|uniref:ATP-binding protein n=1 Tax=Paenibacillus sp. FSL R7-0204 TaxID=2921675 RepID=UPI0030F6EE87